MEIKKDGNKWECRKRGWEGGRSILEERKEKDVKKKVFQRNFVIFERLLGSLQKPYTPTPHHSHAEPHTQPKICSSRGCQADQREAQRSRVRSRRIQQWSLPSFGPNRVANLKVIYRQILIIRNFEVVIFFRPICLRMQHLNKRVKLIPLIVWAMIFEVSLPHYPRREYRNFAHLFFWK